VKQGALDGEAEQDLTALCERHGLGAAQRGQLEAITAALVEDGRAPTTIRDPRRAIGAHLADSLTGMELRAVREAGKIADLGSGAGFPGLALAVALPRCAVHLVESQTRKCAFMERVCVAAGIDNARVVRVRAEEWTGGIDANDVAVVRALAAQPIVLEYAAPLLRVGGTLVDWRGRRDRAEEAAAAVAAAELGLRPVEVRRVEPYEGVRDHHLHVYVKELSTPTRFPRRAGVARRRPLTTPAAQRADGDRR
jgi:16S rRNA (guanine527-N7)-methyltransferase